MERINKGLNRNTVSFLLVFAAGLLLRGVNQRGSLLYPLVGLIQTALFSGLIAAWCLLIRRRLIQKGIRRYLTAVCLLLMLWFLLRGLKYYAFLPGTDAARHLWYAYYFPLLFFPVCALNAMMHMGRPDDWNQPVQTRLIFMVPLFLWMLVFTNDLHRLIFTFPDRPHVWSDMAYGYGQLYPFVSVWILFCVGAAFFLMVRRCRIPRNRSLYRWLPLMPALLGLFYCGAYAVGKELLPVTDLIITVSFLTILTFELAIRLGYIRSNSHYQEVFRLSSTEAQILDQDLTPWFVSNGFSSYNREDVLTSVREGSCIREHMRMTAEPIHGGFVVWREDIGELLELQEQLAASNEHLADRHMVMMQNYETRVRRKKLEEQNRLYNEMQKQTRDKVELLEILLERFRDEKSGKDADLLLSIGVLTAYLKRRNNLILLAENTAGFPVSELKNCIHETILLLETFGITCVLYMNSDGFLSFTEIVDRYDGFEMVIEETCVLYPAYFASLTEEQGRPVLRIRISGIHTMPERISSRFPVEEEDGEFIIFCGGA